MTDSKPLVSIGMPVYNGEQYIRQALVIMPPPRVVISKRSINWRLLGSDWAPHLSNELAGGMG